MTNPFDPDLQNTLDALHAAAGADAAKWAAGTGSADPAANASGGGDLVRLGDFFLAVSPEQGRFLYQMVRATGARCIVEFGASYGISALYLAAAVRANGGRLITTEVHPDKCRALKETFTRAGLADCITLLEGDARETLKQVEGPVDLLHLDGWKSGYLPVFELLHPQLQTGALVLADNCHHEAAQDYLNRVQDPQSGCLTTIQGELAVSCVVAGAGCGEPA